jgi:hypothetical protein
MSKINSHQILRILVGFEILTVASIKMSVFWVVVPCSLVEVKRRFRGTCRLHHYCPDDGGSKHLRNIGKLLPDYMALQPRRHSFSSWNPTHSWCLDFIPAAIPFRLSLDVTFQTCEQNAWNTWAFMFLMSIKNNSASVMEWFELCDEIW